MAPDTTEGPEKPMGERDAVALRRHGVHSGLVRKQAAGVLVALLAASGCASAPGDGDRLASDVTTEQTPQPEPEPEREGVPPVPERPPLPEEIGPDGDLLPGTPRYQQREVARAEYEALVARQTAAAQALAPEVDAFAREDPRTADLLAGATYDLAGALPVGQPAVGASLMYTLPVPRDFRTSTPTSTARSPRTTAWRLKTTSVSRRSWRSSTWRPAGSWDCA